MASVLQQSEHGRYRDIRIKAQPSRDLGAAAHTPWRLARPVNLLKDGDTLSHIVIGRWIIKHHALPFHDPFTFPFPGRIWVSHEWLAEIVFAALYDVRRGRRRLRDRSRDRCLLCVTDRCIAAFNRTAVGGNRRGTGLPLDHRPSACPPARTRWRCRCWYLDGGSDPGARRGPRPCPPHCCR